MQNRPIPTPYVEPWGTPEKHWELILRQKEPAGLARKAFNEVRQPAILLEFPDGDRDIGHCIVAFHNLEGVPDAIKERILIRIFDRRDRDMIGIRKEPHNHTRH